MNKRCYWERQRVKPGTDELCMVLKIQCVSWKWNFESKRMDWRRDVKHFFSYHDTGAKYKDVIATGDGWWSGRTISKIIGWHCSRRLRGNLFFWIFAKRLMLVWNELFNCETVRNLLATHTFTRAVFALPHGDHKFDFWMFVLLIWEQPNVKCTFYHYIYY